MRSRLQRQRVDKLGTVRKVSNQRFGGANSGPELVAALRWSVRFLRHSAHSPDGPGDPPQAHLRCSNRAGVAVKDRDKGSLADFWVLVFIRWTLCQWLSHWVRKLPAAFFHWLDFPHQEECRSGDFHELETSQSWKFEA